MSTEISLSSLLRNGLVDSPFSTHAFIDRKMLPSYLNMQGSPLLRPRMVGTPNYRTPHRERRIYDQFSFFRSPQMVGRPNYRTPQRECKIFDPFTFFCSPSLEKYGPFPDSERVFTPGNLKQVNESVTRYPMDNVECECLAFYREDSPLGGFDRMKVKVSISETEKRLAQRTRMEKEREDSELFKKPKRKARKGNWRKKKEHEVVQSKSLPKKVDEEKMEAGSGSKSSKGRKKLKRKRKEVDCSYEPEEEEDSEVSDCFEEDIEEERPRKRRKMTKSKKMKKKMEKTKKRKEKKKRRRMKNSVIVKIPERTQKGRSFFLPGNAVTYLEEWFLANVTKPYPTKVTGLSQDQVSNWFSNIRKRKWLMIKKYLGTGRKRGKDVISQVKKSEFGKEMYALMKKSEEFDP